MTKKAPERLAAQIKPKALNAHERSSLHRPVLWEQSSDHYVAMLCRTLEQAVHRTVLANQLQAYTAAAGGGFVAPLIPAAMHNAIRNRDAYVALPTARNLTKQHT